MQQSIPSREQGRAASARPAPAKVLGPLDQVSKLVDSITSGESSSVQRSEKAETPADKRPAEAEPDDDVQRYMADLLARSRGGAVTAPSTAAPAPEAPVVRRPKPAPAPAGPDGPAPAPEAVRRPKSTPESVRDLQQMRELANINARQALQVHTTRQLGSAMGRWVLLSALCSGFSVALAILSPPRFGIPCLSAVGFLLAAIYCAVRYVCLAHSVEPVANEHGIDRWLTTTALRISEWTERLPRLGRK